MVMSSRICLAVLVGVMVGLLTGCGGSSSSSNSSTASAPAPASGSAAAGYASSAGTSTSTSSSSPPSKSSSTSTAAKPAELPSGAVASVAGTPITKTAFEHWMKVAFASSASGTTEKAVVPDPPNYSACISHLAAKSSKPARGLPVLGTTQFKLECEARYQSVQSEVLGSLISWQWTVSEAEALGVHVSDVELQKEAESMKADKALSSSGETTSDLLLLAKVNLLGQKIQKRLLRKVKKENKATRAQALGKFVSEFKKRWTARTECGAGYVVPGCKEYKPVNATPRGRAAR